MITKAGEELVALSRLLEAARVLEKTAVARWKAELSGLSTDSQEELRQRVAKSVGEEIAGINAGTTTLLNDIGGVVHYVNNPDKVKELLEEGGAYTVPIIENNKFTGAEVYCVDPKYLRNLSNWKYNKTVKITPMLSGVKKKNIEYVLAHILRHEAEEARALKRGIDAGSVPDAKIFAVRNPQKIPDERKGIALANYLVAKNKNLAFSDFLYQTRKEQNDLISSSHASPYVLAAETRLLNQSAHNNLAASIKRVRRHTGESEVLTRSARLDRTRGDVYSSRVTNKDYQDMGTGKHVLVGSDTKQPSAYYYDMPSTIKYFF